MLPGAATASSLVVAIFMPVFTPVFTPVLAPTLASAFPPVSVAAAPGLPCPTADAVERAIAGLRGADPAATGPTYRLRIGPVGDSVRADLTSADGAAVWTRALPGGMPVTRSMR